MTTHKKHHCHCCACNHAENKAEPDDLTRRDFVMRVGALTVGGLVMSPFGTMAADDYQTPKRRPLAKQTLKVQPVLMYDTPKRREATSWRNWGGIQTEQDAGMETTRISAELAKMAKNADFSVDIRPVLGVRNAEQAAEVAKGDHDVLIIYAAGGWQLERLLKPDKWNIIFLRHDPGPAYLWYEIIHPRFLRKTVDEYAQTGIENQDVVTDSYDELLWRLRALYGLKSTLGKKIVAIGGAGGWGAGGRTAPDRTRELWKMEIIDYPYRDLAPRIAAAMQNADLVKYCKELARRYLRPFGVKLNTTREFVDNAFVLNEVFLDVMDELQTDAMTINACMGTIMPMSKTTACLPLSLLNDAGYLAFCESDFVVIPSGVLLHYISGKPVFLNDPTYPHDDTVTLAHCTAPRKMDGRHLERVKVMTHFESDYGAAPKVEMRIGEKCTNIVPDFASRKWVGFEGTIIANPFEAICRSQVDVKINGDCAALVREMKGFHWMMSYGNYMQETGYALRKVGVDWLDVSQKKGV